MDKPIPEAVAVTLHQDRAGCEWIIVTSKDHPDSESEVTPSDDPALFDLLKALTAAQQQGQAVYQWRRFANRWEDMTQAQYDEVQATGEIVIGDEVITSNMVRKLYTAPPPSVPVGVVALANHFDSVRNGLPDEWQDFAAEFSRDLRALAQQPEARGVVECDDHSWHDFGQVNRSWCSKCNAVAVTGYEDRPYGTLTEARNGR